MNKKRHLPHYNEDEEFNLDSKYKKQKKHRVVEEYLGFDFEDESEEELYQEVQRLLK